MTDWINRIPEDQRLVMGLLLVVAIMLGVILVWGNDTKKTKNSDSTWALIVLGVPIVFALAYFYLKSRQ